MYAVSGGLVVEWKRKVQPAMTRDEVLSVLRDHQAELRERFGVKSLALFGSVARGEAVETSDVDLLVEFDRTVTLFDLAARLRLQELLGVAKVDLVMRDSIYPELRKPILEGAIHVG